GGPPRCTPLRSSPLSRSLRMWDIFPPCKVEESARSAPVGVNCPLLGGRWRRSRSERRRRGFGLHGGGSLRPALRALESGSPADDRRALTSEGGTHARLRHPLRGSARGARAIHHPTPRTTRGRQRLF